MQHYNVRPTSDQPEVFSKEQEDLVLDGDNEIYGMQQPQEQDQDQLEDESSVNRTLPKDHDHGNAAHIRETRGTRVRAVVIGKWSAERFRLESSATADRDVPCSSDLANEMMTAEGTYDGGDCKTGG